MSTVEQSVIDDVLEVEPADEVRFATNYNEWSNPLVVVDATEPIEWDVPLGENWLTRDLELQTDRETRYLIEFRSHDKSRCYTLKDGVKDSHQGFLRKLERCEPDDDRDAAEDGTSTEDDTPTSNVDSESEAEADVALEEDAADDAPADAGDDVQDEIVTEEITVDGVDDDEGEVFECSCGETFETQQALQGHGPKSCEGSEDEDGIDLPDGVTAADVDELTSGGIEIGDLADELGIHRNEARAIAHELGYYKRVREVWTDRGQIDPRAIGILVLLVGLLFMAAISIGVMVP